MVDVAEGVIAGKVIERGREIVILIGGGRCIRGREREVEREVER